MNNRANISTSSGIRRLPHEKNELANPAENIAGHQAFSALEPEFIEALYAHNNNSNTTALGMFEVIAAAELIASKREGLPHAVRPQIQYAVSKFELSIAHSSSIQFSVRRAGYINQEWVESYDSLTNPCIPAAMGNDSTEADSLIVRQESLCLRCRSDQKGVCIRNMESIQRPGIPTTSFLVTINNKITLVQHLRIIAEGVYPLS